MRRLHITVELESDSEPIRGSVSGETTTRTFTGWMQLITALQAAVDEDDTQPSEPECGADMSTELHQTPED